MRQRSATAGARGASQEDVDDRCVRQGGQPRGDLGGRVVDGLAKLPGGEWSPRRDREGQLRERSACSQRVISVGTLGSSTPLPSALPAARRSGLSMSPVGAGGS